MYEGFYGFRERPFTLLPDPDFLFLDKKHRAALDMLETAVTDRSGFCVISGEIGAGKTTLIRELLNRLDESVCVGLVSNTHPSFGELLQWIMAAYGLSSDDCDEPDLHKRFIEFVIQQFTQKKHTLLIIDEAQNLSVQALEELRLLSDVNSERDLILQVILVGQQQLRDRLQQPELGLFSESVTLNYHLQALNQDETCRYIQHRVSHAGGQTGLFGADACQAVYRLSGGIPRVINRLCDLSLVYGCTAKSKVITAELVERVGEDQRMGTLLDIPQVDPEVTEPGQTEQPVEVSAQEKDESGTSSVVTDTNESPVQVTDSSESATEAGRLSSDTIVGAISPVLMPELEAAVNGKADSAEKAAPSELHQLVVNHEQKKRVRGERGALWLLLVVVIMAGGTGWLMRDFQSADPVALSRDGKEQVASAKEKSSESEIADNYQEDNIPKGENDRPPSVADKSDPVKQGAGKDVQAGDVLVRKAEKEEAAAKQRAAELSRQAEETARLKKESDRMAREQHAAEQRLAKQRAARKELERKARLEREKMATAKAEVAAQQRAAELNRQAEKTARLKKESDRVEREKMAAAKQAAKKLAEERSRTSTGPSGKVAKKAAPQKPLPAVRIPVGFVEAEVISYDEDDGDALVLEAKERFASENTVGVAASPDSPVAALADGDGGAIAQTTNDEGKVEFAANPCTGPTARFLSTCR